jgi:hypothetical protein
VSEPPRSEAPPGPDQGWAGRVARALFCLAAPLFAASAFLAFEAVRGIRHDIAFELAMATLFGCLLPLIVVALAARRGLWSGRSTTVFCAAAMVVAVVFALLAGVLDWVS